MSITANLGDVKTTFTHSPSTTHVRFTAERRTAAGIGENLIRISVGVEFSVDIIADLGRSLG